ncbi:unnamed protein product [Allacma fusca]|uniref:BEACH domain-containing protein n=1 Tax=Allacma fusca TaxID=39272 RepID=A0A8J2PRI1_9HEXA|nr:unnamed protein product [Allacma fusca]
MAKAVDDIPASANPLKRFHVSQTADQLPDVRIRNAIYREELERQIQEKRDRERRQREFEAEEEERLEKRIQAEREKVRREMMEETERRKLQVTEDRGSSSITIIRSGQEETRRRQAVIAKRLEEIQQAAQRKKQEEAEKRKRYYLEHLYNPTSRSTSITEYYRTRPWNSRDYVHQALNLSLEEIYRNAPLHLLADVYKKLEYEKAKMREIIRSRIANED